MEISEKWAKSGVFGPKWAENGENGASKGGAAEIFKILVHAADDVGEF